MNESTRILFNGQLLRSYLHTCDSTSVVVTFDHWRKARSGFPPTTNGQIFLDRGFDFIRVDTAQNDWFVNTDFRDAFSRTAQALGRYHRIVFVGFSMGAIGALFLQRIISADTLVAISPSFDERVTKSPLDLLIQKETTQNERQKILIHYDSNSKTDTDSALKYASYFSEPNLIDLFEGGHPATNTLVRDGSYDKLIDEWLANEISIDKILAIHTNSIQRRGSGVLNLEFPLRFK